MRILKHQATLKNGIQLRKDTDEWHIFYFHTHTANAVASKKQLRGTNVMIDDNKNDFGDDDGDEEFVVGLSG
jgi:hypothetical protein